MSACRDFEVLVSLRAAGATEGDDARLLDAHLVGCERCRREASELAVALRLAKVPMPSQAERRAFTDLPERTLRAYERAHERRSVARRIGVTVAVSAAFVLALVVPFTLERRDATPEVASAPASVPSGAAAIAAAPTDAALPDVGEGWQEPDLDVLWADAAVVSADLAVDLGD